MAGGKHLLGRARGRHIFGTAKVGERGQIVIPKDAREVFGIRPGDTLLILGDEENGILVTKPEVLNDVAQKIFQNLTVSVASVGIYAELNFGNISFISVIQILRKLGSITKTNRQNAGRQRIQRSDVSGFFGVKQAANLLHSILRRNVAIFI